MPDEYLFVNSPLKLTIERTDAEAPVRGPVDVKNCLFRKDPDAGKD